MFEINEMSIRVPELNKEDGQQLGEQVAQRLTERLPAQTERRHIEALDVRLSLLPGMGQGKMADAIAEQILRQLKMM